jgi:hypothetical protein
MNHDVDLMRDLMFLLEERQASPRTTVVLSIQDEADDLGRLPDVIEASLDLLLDLEYIDGPGRDEPGFWLFRKLTRKGVDFVKATRQPRDWEQMKRHFSTQQSAS